MAGGAVESTRATIGTPGRDVVSQLVHEISRSSELIIVAGDVMTDVWLHGHHEACQDKCSKFVVEDRFETPGGAANAANCLQHWHGRVELYGSAWSKKTRLLRSLKFDNNQVITFGSEHKPSCPESGNVIFRVDEDKRGPLSDWSRRVLLESIPHAGVCLISDYDKDTLSPELIRRIIDSCFRHNVPCVVDAKRRPTTYTGALLKCNAAYSLRWGGVGDVITDGENPPIVNGKRLALDLPPVPCVNHVGAGDCFAAHLALGIAYELPLEDAAALAHSAGRVYVRQLHSCSPLPGEVMVDMNARRGGVPLHIAQDTPQGVPSSGVVGCPDRGTEGESAVVGDS